MTVNLAPTLRKALQTLAKERSQIDRQIEAIRKALKSPDGMVRRRPSGRRKRMSPAARKAVARRMKAYWAKRRSGAKAKPSETK